MKLEDRHDFGINRTTLEIHDAVERVLDGSDYGAGELEALRDTVENQSKLLGRLTEMMYDAGMISKDVLLHDLLSYRFDEYSDELL